MTCAAKVTIAELCWREGIADGLYGCWSKEFLEAGKSGLTGDMARSAPRRRAGTVVETDLERSFSRALTADPVSPWRLPVGYACQSVANGRIFARHILANFLGQYCSVPIPVINRC